jgi:serine/threonine protein phosphatase PrpC
MGGHVGGKEASRLAVRSILEHFSREKYSNIIQAIDQAFQFANEQIYVHTQVQPELRGMGTTGVILVVKDDLCFFGHVGDSRLYLKTDNELHRITKDHSYVQELVDKNVISDEEAEQHPKKNQILRALGHQSEVKPDVCELPVKVKNGDVFLLCSDGLNGMVNDQVMNGMIDPNNLSDSKNRLFEAAMANGGHDNISLILLGVSGSPHIRSEFKSQSPSRVRRVQEHSFERTAQFSSVDRSESPARTSQGSGINKWIIVAASVLVLVAGGITTYKLLWDKDADDGKTTGHRGGQIYTIDDLKILNYEKLEELAENKVEVTLQNGDLLTIDDKTYVLTIEDRKLTNVEEKKSTVVVVEPPVADPPAAKDTDGDGVIDSKDPCPNDKLNKCKTNPPPPVKTTSLPKGVKSHGNNQYSVQAQAAGETIIKIYSRLNSKDSIKDLGPTKRICKPSEIVTLNNKKNESDTIKGGTWVKFKVY